MPLVFSQNTCCYYRIIITALSLTLQVWFSNGEKEGGRKKRLAQTHATARESNERKIELLLSTSSKRQPDQPVNFTEIRMGKMKLSLLTCSKNMLVEYPNTKKEQNCLPRCKSWPFAIFMNRLSPYRCVLCDLRFFIVRWAHWWFICAD